MRQRSSVVTCCYPVLPGTVPGLRCRREAHVGRTAETEELGSLPIQHLARICCVEQLLIVPIANFRQSHKHAGGSVWAALLSRRPMKEDGVTGRSPCKHLGTQRHSSTISDDTRCFCLFTHSSSLDSKPQLALRQLYAGEVLHTAVETSDACLAGHYA